MKLLGFEISRVARPRALTTVEGSQGWFPIIREGYTGAFQQNVVIDAPRDILSFSAVFACVSGIATDLAKLCLELMQKDANGIGTCVEESTPTSPYLAILRKPNSYQGQFKFFMQWMCSKLLHGNAYALKKRDGRNVIRELYILDPTKVTPLITDSGDVYYRLGKNPLAEITDSDTIVAASEIIHDSMYCLWHPLVGVSPIYACATSATMGNRIQGNSEKFFRNQSRPSGMLTSPSKISDVTANRLKETFEQGFSGQNVGRLFVGGDGLEYKAMMMSATDAELVDQLKWTVEDVARAYHYPLWKIGGAIPTHMTVETLNQLYYADCLQGLIEAAEDCLTYGLELPAGYYLEFDLEGLLRMDAPTRYKAKSDAVKGGWMAPNEARKGEDLAPVQGGDTPYLQQQNFSLEALAKRDASADPFASAKPPAGGGSGANDGAETPATQAVRELALVLKALASPAAPEREETDEEFAGFSEAFETLHAPA